MCLVGELLWKRAAPKPSWSEQGFRFTGRAQGCSKPLPFETSSGGSILLFLTQETGGAGLGGE